MGDPAVEYRELLNFKPLQLAASTLPILSLFQKAWCNRLCYNGRYKTQLFTKMTAHVFNEEFTQSE